MPYNIRMYSENQKSQKNFEIHEFKDHFVQVMAGTLQFDIGGVPIDASTTEKGEQIAQNVKYSKLVTLGVGDVLVIPRGTPHKRIVTDSSVFLMMSIDAPNRVLNK